MMVFGKSGREFRLVLLLEPSEYLKLNPGFLEYTP